MFNISPYFQKFINISLFRSSYGFLIPPIFDYGAFMHHVLHVLDAPANESGWFW